MSTIENQPDLKNTICVFGIGALFSQCYGQICLILGKKPDFLCDNAPEKWGRKINGIPCISPKELEQKASPVTVIIAVRNYELIHTQLRESGITTIFTFTFDRTYNVISHLRALNQAKVSLNKALVPDVKGKWALVTGASRGIGYQIALALAKLGVNIITHSRQQKHNDPVIEKCREYGVKTVSVGAELENNAAIEQMIKQVDYAVKQVDFLINCAGIAPKGLANIWAQNEQDYVRAFAVNTIAPILLCNHFVPKMISQRFGRIINISSNIHHRPAEMAYACSKAALDKYIFDISPTLENSGVLISVVDPGWLKTDMGGEHAPHPVESVVPGAILGIIMPHYKNGQWFTSQDYVGMTIEDAANKAYFISHEEEL